MPSAVRLHERCACSVPSGSFALAGTSRKYERSRPFQTRHLALELEIDFDSKSVKGTARLDLTRSATDVSRLELDAVDFEIESVRMDVGSGWQASRYEYDGDKLALEPPPEASTVRVEVKYAAHPRRGLYFIGPDAKLPHKPVQVWSQCQDEDARHWFPCQDKPNVKMTSELAVTVPRGFVALSNGELVDKRRAGGSRERYHFRLDRPHPSYLVTLVVGKFEVLSASAPSGDPARGDIALAYYVENGRRDDAERTFAETPRMLGLIAELTGVPYPYSRYSQVVVSDFVFGGMENTTATTLYEHVLLDERAALDVTSNDLIVHELAHQWFGNYVTCRDWSHAWLNEGFATFFEHLERGSREGRDAYDFGILSDLSSYLAEADGRYRRAIVCRDYELPIDLFDRHLYEKGGLVLHLLRRELGDGIFWRGVKLYLERNAYGIVETRDLERALEEVSGRSLEQFFDQWVYRPGHPALKVKVTWENAQLSVHVAQTQRTGEVPVFDLMLEVDICTAEGKIERHGRRSHAERDALVVSLAERPRWVAFDPEIRVIGAVRLEAPPDLLRAQLGEAPSVAGRIAAAKALGQRGGAQSLRALGESLLDEAVPWMVRSAAARALGNCRAEDAVEPLCRAAKTPHPKVRRAIAEALGNFRTARAAHELGALANRDASYLVRAEACRSLGATRESAGRAVLERALRQKSWAEVVRAGALDGLGKLADEETLGIVLAESEYGKPPRARRAAVRALPRFSDERKVARKLEELLDDGDPHLRTEVVLSLETLGTKDARSALRGRLSRELDGRVKRRIREALRNMRDSSRRDRKRMNDELERVRGEMSDLRTRLSKLEQLSGSGNGARTDRTAKESSKPPHRTRPGKAAPGRHSAAAKGAAKRKPIGHRGAETKRRRKR
jgi:aminopeptidase N